MADLRKLVEARLGPAVIKGGRPFWRCPFHKEKTPSFGVTPNGRRLYCFGCRANVDDIDFVRALDRVSFAEAHRIARGRDPDDRLVGSAGLQGGFRPTPVDPSPSDPPPVAWQEQARVFVNYCQGELFTEAGRVALDWLHGRGLRDETIERWRLGYHERDRWRDPGRWGLNGGKKVWLAAGLVIPWTVDGAVWHVKVRRFESGPKYVVIRDGVPALYGLDLLTRKEAVVICEAELDAVLLWQAAGDLVDVVAVGAKGARVAVPFLARLLGASVWLLALDNDARREARVWADYTPRVRRARPLQGNDLTEFAQAGGNLRAWARFHLDR